MQRRQTAEQDVILHTEKKRKRQSMNTAEYIKNQVWEMKYEMLQSFCGLADNQLKKFISDHWPISWHIQHCMHVIDFMINTHISGKYEIEHYEDYKHWPLLTPASEWEYPSSIELQQRWIKLLNKLIQTIDTLSEKQLNSASKTSYNNELLIESFLRIINHTNTHLRCIWSLVSLLEKGKRLPDQGIWIPKRRLFKKIKSELQQGLKEAGRM